MAKGRRDTQAAAREMRPTARRNVQRKVARGNRYYDREWIQATERARQEAQILAQHGSLRTCAVGSSAGAVHCDGRRMRGHPAHARPLSAYARDHLLLLASTVARANLWMRRRGTGKRYRRTSGAPKFPGSAAIVSGGRRKSWVLLSFRRTSLTQALSICRRSLGQRPTVPSAFPRLPFDRLRENFLTDSAQSASPKN